MSDFFSSGSEDFRGYMWKIPSVSELTARRRKVEWDDWTSHERSNVVGIIYCSL